MVDAIAAPLYPAVRSVTQTAPLEKRAAPNVAQETGADDFPPDTAELVFTPAAQGRFANTESFIAVAQNGGGNFDVFGNNPARAYGNAASAQSLTEKLDQLLKDLEA